MPPSKLESRLIADVCSQETEEGPSNIIDTSASEDEDDSVCSIVMATTESADRNNENETIPLKASDLMTNYALMLEVPATLTTSNDQI
jgi:hypothetical protein